MTVTKEGLNHFWSSDGAECLWCFRIRTPEEIAAWVAAGKPDELCKPPLLPDMLKRGYR